MELTALDLMSLVAKGMFLGAMATLVICSITYVFYKISEA